MDSGGADGGAESKRHRPIPVAERLEASRRSDAGFHLRRRRRRCGWVGDVDGAVGGQESGPNAIIPNDAFGRQKGNQFGLALRLSHVERN